MTLDAEVLEHRAPAALRDRDHRIAVAGGWVCMVDALADIGVWFLSFLAHEIEPSVEGPKGPILAIPRFRDPLTALARAARAMHLAIALAFRIENEIDALRAGKPIGPDACISPSSRAKATGMTDLSQAAGEMADPGEQERGMALQAIAEAVKAPKRPEGLRGRFNAAVLKDRAFYRLLKGPLKDAVAAICADLGLKPDWSLWTEDGFPRPGARKEDWIAFFLPQGDGGSPPTPDRLEPTRSPPRGGGHRACDKAWRPPWPPPEPDDPAPLYRPAATRPPDRLGRPDDPVSRTRRATLLGTTIIAGAPGAAERAIARLIKP
jgi:hypothetical protein